MACIMRECPNPECGYADTKHPYQSDAVAWCPHCKSILDVTFDEDGDHNREDDEPEEDGLQ